MHLPAKIELRRPKDIFLLALGQGVSKRNLFNLIQLSKIEGSDYWGGEDDRINNTPQQGINWIGRPPLVRAVIIKTRAGSYEHDGWIGDDNQTYRYSFKARKGVVTFKESANQVLLEQPQHLYPVLLFTEAGSDWIFEGRFAVEQVAEQYVVLRRGTPLQLELNIQNEATWREGGRRYVTHLLAERSHALVEYLKSVADPICEICGDDLMARYGVACIEAHHKTPLAKFTDRHEVKSEDLALLCPNCHRAVHVLMRQGEPDYHLIRRQLRKRLSAIGEQAGRAVLLAAD